MFEILKENKKNSFYPVEREEIINAEGNMGVIIPKALSQFYLTVGYGFLETRGYNANRIMDPESVEEFRLGIGQFENSEEVELLEKYTGDKLVFFEVNESLFLSIGISKFNNGKIFYYDEVIAEDLSEFLERYLEDERYFLDER